MADLSKQEIEQLKAQLEQKKTEVKDIYDKLVEAGAIPLPDDFLEDVAGGGRPTIPNDVPR